MSKKQYIALIDNEEYWFIAKLFNETELKMLTTDEHGNVRPQQEIIRRINELIKKRYKI